MISQDRPVVICGAGPTGLLLALWLQRFNVPFRIVEKSERAENTSRAVIVHARTIELYRQLGIADEIVAGGVPAKRWLMRYNGQKRVDLPLYAIGEGLSKYPYILAIPQDRHETILEKVLVQRGGKVERGLEVTGITTDESSGDVQVQCKNESFAASYLVGCDGAHSAVRTFSPGFKMEGGTYPRRFFVADVMLSSPSYDGDELSLNLSNEDLMIMLPLYKKGHARLIGFLPAELEHAETITFEDAKATVTRNSDATIDKVNWFSHYKVHHRMATSFRQGRVFLVGDAAHLHSPVGGQGMNTGLGDATNLAWKLATAYRGQDQAKLDSVGPEMSVGDLLDSYEVERMAFARKLVSTTDRVFNIVTGNGIVSWFVRNIAFPYIWPFLIRNFNLGRFIFRRISQIEIEYRISKLSEQIWGQAHGTIRAGDRLPWVRDAREARPGQPDGEEDNHASLSSSWWQGHVYGTAPEILAEKLDSLGLELHTFAWSEQTEAAGLSQNEVYLIRPDGYIGAVLSSQPAEQEAAGRALLEYCRKWGITGL